MNNGYFNSNLNIPIYTNNQDEKGNDMENTLKVSNKLKLRVYMTFPYSTEWKDHIFEGILESSMKDCIVLSNPTNGSWYILPLIYVDYYEFLESLSNYIK